MSFGSFDFIEEACDVMDKSDMPYLLIAMCGERKTVFYHNLGEDGDNARTIIELIDSGWLPDEIKETLTRQYDL